MMRIAVLAFQIYWLAVEIQSSKGQHYPKDAVICSHSESSLTLRCGNDEVLRIHKATYARMPERYRLCTESVVPQIESDAECNLEFTSTRCHGERVCTIERQEAEQYFPSCDSNILHVRYSCEKVRKANSTVVVLPLLQGNVTGKALRVLSPYYPCNIPSQPGNFSCKVAATSSIPASPLVSLKLGLFVKLDHSKNNCDEDLKVATLTEPQHDYRFCTQGAVTRINRNFPVKPLDENLVEFTYSKSFSAEGGKFVLDIEAFQSNRSLDLKISCENQENFTLLMTLSPPRVTPSALSPSLSEGCKPLSEAEGGNRDDPKDLTWIVVVVVVVMILGSVVVVIVYRVRKRRQENKTGRRMELVPTAPTPTPIPSPEGMAIYSVARDIDEDDFLPNVKNGNLTQQEVDDVSHMYAVVDKSRKTKAKSNDNSNVVNDVMKADNGDVIMCENDELYDVTSRGDDKQKL